MQRLSCPYCGLRDESEFVCGGEAHRVRPVAPAATEHWVNYLYYRENRKGLVRERWHHVYGCRRWFNLARDNVTHEVLASYAMDVPLPMFPNHGDRW